jgi:hypothetical protein
MNGFGLIRHMNEIRLFCPGSAFLLGYLWTTRACCDAAAAVAVTLSSKLSVKGMSLGICSPVIEDVRSEL